jgi:hypothetical protein
VLSSIAATADGIQTLPGAAERVNACKVSSWKTLPPAAEQVPITGSFEGKQPACANHFLPFPAALPAAALPPLPLPAAFLASAAFFLRHTWQQHTAQTPWRPAKDICQLQLSSGSVDMAGL